MLSPNDLLGTFRTLCLSLVSGKTYARSLTELPKGKLYKTVVMMRCNPSREREINALPGSRRRGDEQSLGLLRSQGYNNSPRVWWGREVAVPGSGWGVAVFGPCSGGTSSVWVL